jgi:hypothetical protein
MTNYVKDIVEISKYTGVRFDLVQADGGNNLVKFNKLDFKVNGEFFLFNDKCFIERELSKYKFKTLILAI